MNRIQQFRVMPVAVIENAVWSPWLMLRMRLQSPPVGSTLITSAPCRAISMPQYGAASPWERSTTLRPANGAS